MQVGVDYYPEQCDESRWATDVDLMNRAGLSVVRIAEFAWSRMEPSEGRFDFAWLDRILKLFHDAGIQVVLGTPTATPPAWLHAKHPDIYPADKRNYRLGFGTREQRCLNNPDMRSHSRRIVLEMVKRYASHPGVVGWQTDNELTANLCYCPVCAEKFRVWLRAKYVTLDELNAAWGTSFWSQEYSDWSQIPLPWQVKCGDFHNPSLQLEYRRFQSQATVEFQQDQIAILREYAPHHFVTHNLMGLHNSTDYYDLARSLDFVSWDNYPLTPWAEEPFGAPLASDVMRGIKQKNVWVMEQQNGITGWNTMGRRPSGEWLRCAAWQMIAHGADTVVFFRWQTARHGTEQFWHGILNHDGKPRRRYREVKEFCADVRALSDALDGTVVKSDVAILNGYEQHYAMEIQPQAEGLGIWDQIRRFYKPLKGFGLNVDVIPISADLSAYKVVIAPSWFILKAEDAAKLTDYVRRGGTLVLNPRTGVKDELNACHPEALPALLHEIAGVEVDDYDPLGNRENTIRTANGTDYEVTVWADALALKGAKSVAHYTQSVFADEPAITKHHCGLGSTYYFGVFGEPALYRELLAQILDEAGVGQRFSLPEGVDISIRENDDAQCMFVINFNESEQTLAMPEGLVTLKGAEPVDGLLTLPAQGLGIYQLETARVAQVLSNGNGEHAARKEGAAKDHVEAGI